jgi:prepilin-type N-terminal cleavage/methylation domain-containing protein
VIIEELRRRTRDERGVTLVELLVVMIIMGVVGGITTTAIVTSLHSAQHTQQRVQAMHELETALQRMTRDLRMAEAFVMSDDTDHHNEVTVAIHRAGTDAEVTYRVVEQVVGEDETVEVLVREDTEQVLVTLVQNSEESLPVFDYLDAMGQPLACADDCGSVYAKAPQIRVRLVRGIEGREPVVVETLVSVRNLRYQRS